MKTNRPPLYLTRDDLENGRFPADALTTHDVHLCGNAPDAATMATDQKYTATHPDNASALRGVLAEILTDKGPDTLRQFIQRFESTHGRMSLPPEFSRYRG